MTIVFFILAFILIIALSNKKKKKSTGHVTTNYKYAINKKPSPTASKQNSDLFKMQQDDSIIDVTGKSQPIIPLQDSNTESRSSSVSDLPHIYDEYRLGKLYKNKLNLSNQEVSWLNKFWNPNNVFIGIEGCCIETIKLYLATLKELNKQLKKKESSIQKEVEFFQTEISQFYKSNNYWAGYDSSYLKEKGDAEFFSTIFKRSENVVREAFGHKRKISGEFAYPNTPINIEYERRIGSSVDQIILSLAQQISPPDEETENELNSQNTTRWKIKFEKLEQAFSEENKQDFINGIYALEKANQKNPSIENIFFEASKFISKADKTEALKFYICYLYYDLKSDRIDNKQLTKTIQKNLFKTNEQLHDFEKIVADLVKNKNLENAIAEVSKIHQPKRKKIQLDESTIKEVQLQDKGTVELLNEYLKDEFEDLNTIVKAQEISVEELQIEIESVSNEEGLSDFVKDVSINKNQADALVLFAEKSFLVPISEFDNYCKSQGLFKNQLIDSINDSCYDFLDDVLIEEDGDCYTINENYFKKISQK
ncbi:tellurite resistance TerB C-terminal domain-containing protein [Chitinophagaceae bacterium 26-R-25]|nr:tellurite resistance TerB C-terminal domain-containing protein [Chitinophagaceae bacterium 26-R-25]